MKITKDFNLVQQLTTLIINLLNTKTNNQPESYGFEYEFLPEKILYPDDMIKLYQFLHELGFPDENGIFLSSSGLHIAFEPGGQIEYCSPPLLANDKDTFFKILDIIEKTNKAIANKLDINYIGTDFFPNRKDSPLCLLSERYKQLHNRMLHCSTRGREMMKGTASIHLHKRITHDLSKLVPIYQKLCKLSKGNDFKMSKERRDIWNHTDPSRCGLPTHNPEKIKTSQQLIEEIVSFALDAIDLKENITYKEKNDITPEDFLNHLTTMFTDVRLNLKGPTMEIRTLNSMPIEKFAGKWEIFINELDIL